MENRDAITSGPIVRTVLRLAIPPVLGMFMIFARSVTDFFWVGKLGATAQDAVMTSMVVLWTVFSLISIISVGITALVSRYIGSKELDKVRHYITQAFSMAVLVSIIIGVFGYFSSPGLLSFMDASEATTLLALPYLRVFFLSGALWAFEETAYAIFRASGDTKTPMWVGSTGVMLNIILDPLLIFGIGPFPELGVMGASVATSISAFVAMTIILIKLKKGKTGYRIDKLFTYSPSWPSIGKIAKIGLPISSQEFIFVAVYWFLIKIVHEFGEIAGAAMGIGNRMESLSYLTCHGFAIAASTLVGQNLGAKKPDRAEKCAWGATGIAVGVTTFVGFFFVVIPGLIASIFTSDPEVHKIAVDYLIILGLSQAAMACEMVIEGSFSGAGNTLPPMLIAIPGAILRVPLAYYLALYAGWGINGVWWTLTITSFAKAIILVLWFRRGVWKTTKL